MSHDLFLYNRQKGTLWEQTRNFSLLHVWMISSVPVLLFTDCLAQTANRRFPFTAFWITKKSEVQQNRVLHLRSLEIRCSVSVRYSAWIHRITFIALSKSFMISADNAHAVHPNHTDKADPVNRPYLNEGIVIKYNANQKYCTDGISAAMFKDICKQIDVPYQTFTNRSDMAGGSTLGNISNTQVALNTVDIGLPQLAMHSPYETAGVKDTEYLLKAAKAFFA